MVDPGIGSMADLRDLVAAAHRRGMAVVLDVVCNHLGCTIRWPTGEGRADGEFSFHDGSPQISLTQSRSPGSALPAHGDALPYPTELRNTCAFHGPAETHPERIRLFGFLEDMRTENPDVRSHLVRVLKYWIANTNIDGFRYDAAMHVDKPFWRYTIAEVDRYARAIGKHGFLQLVEHVGREAREFDAFGELGFSARLNYPLYYRLLEQQVEGIARTLADLVVGPPESLAYPLPGRTADYLFLDNHDRTRILYKIRTEFPDPLRYRAVLQFMLSALILSSCRPYLYYGTEQEFCGATGYHFDPALQAEIGHDHHVREDMFENPACAWIYGPINVPAYRPFSTGQATFQLLRTAIRFRRKYGRTFAAAPRKPLSNIGACLQCVLLACQEVEGQLLIAMNPCTTPASALQTCVQGMREIAEVGLRSPEAQLAIDVHGRLVISLEPFGYVAARLRS